MKRRGLLFLACILVAAAGALAFRLPRLAVRPMHCDEANQAMRAAVLLETGRYRYDPQEHHGPSLYYATLPSFWLSGVQDFAESDEFNYRIVPVVFGTGLILLLLMVGDGLGRPACVVAAILMALSPAMVFYSRYFVQEMLLVFLTFATIACGWRYVRRPSIGWAAAVGAGFGLMHATKETWILAAAAMGISLVLTIAWARFRNNNAGTVGNALRGVSGPQERVSSPLRGTPQRAFPTGFSFHVLKTYFRPLPVLAAVLTAVLVAGIFYSSFGTNWQGPIDSVLAYTTYVRRGSEGGNHSHPWYYYLEILVAYRPSRGFFWTEGLLVGLALIGSCAALFGRGKKPAACGDASDDRPCSGPDWGFCRFLAFYAIALTAIYSAIPYKTPWCLLSFLHALILLAGVGAVAVVCWMPCRSTKVAAALVLSAATVHLGWESYALNFRFPSYEGRNPYVYAHASGDVLNLAAQLERLARISPEGHAMGIHVVTRENYWPLPWYLRRFDASRIGYWQDPAQWRRDAQRQPAPSLIILTDDAQPTVDASLRAAYNRQMSYGLQPGVRLSVYAREDLWDAFVKSMESPAR